MVFNPTAPSCWGVQMAACYRLHEGEKHCAYELRIREVEHGSFTPLVFSTSRGMGGAATVAYKQLVTLIAAKREQPHCVVIGWLQCHLCFGLLRSTIMCLRGSRPRHGHAPLLDAPVDLAVHEGYIPTEYKYIYVIDMCLCSTNVYYCIIIHVKKETEEHAHVRIAHTQALFANHPHHKNYLPET